MKLETLYKTSAKGATQVINMTIEGAVYTREWGQLDGKQQTKSTTALPKNVGKANETTPEQQAIIEAKAVWVKKQKSGYSLSPEAPTTVNLAMKVNEYKKHLKKVAETVFTSPKLNGVNSEYRLVDGELKLLSRGGEEYPVPEHQREEALVLLEALTTESINGEMYCHGEHLQDIMAATKKHNDLTPRLKFHVFDFPEIEGTYQERCTEAYKVLDNPLVEIPNFPFVPVWVADSEEEIEDQFEQVMDAGYEGLIIRNPKGLYKYNTRSLDVFKYKKAEDAEFEVIAFALDKNDHVVFVCKTDLGAEFKVKLKGTDEERLAMAEDVQEFPELYFGKFLKVEFETYSKDGIPLKPVGIMFRKVDENGEASE